MIVQFCTPISIAITPTLSGTRTYCASSGPTICSCSMSPKPEFVINVKSVAREMSPSCCSQGISATTLPKIRISSPWPP